MKTLLFYLLFLNPIFLFSIQLGPSKVTELKNFYHFQDVLINPARATGMEKFAFNTAPEIGTFIAYLAGEYEIDTVIETGTHKASTTSYFAHIFDEVHTIEILEDSFNKCKDTLKKMPHVTCHLGTSETVLEEILPNLAHKPVLFYLDAHWFSSWPLLKELSAITKTHKDNCVIVIDDCKVPGRPDIPFDRYKQQDLSLEYVKPRFETLFTNYVIYYLIPRNVGSKAKLVAIPEAFHRRDLMVHCAQTLDNPA
ncbi:MAG: hypothetical protein KR126chlam1_01125 [Chlamydiae bacterium]|nr:hypothetical protein [Chlamydiota bacterium]